MRTLWLWFVVGWWRWMARWCKRCRKVLKPAHGPTAQVARHRCARKPPWVRRELIRLRAWSPDLSCRKLAEVFNRRFLERDMAVSKSHVADVLRGATVEILRLRHGGKHRVPRAMATHRVWAMDLTGKADLTGKQYMMPGLLDHGSRACLPLTALADK